MSYQKPFVVSVSVFCSLIVILDLNLQSKYYSDLWNFYCKVIFGGTCYLKINVLHFFVDFLCFMTIMRKFQEV